MTAKGWITTLLIAVCGITPQNAGAVAISNGDNVAVLDQEHLVAGAFLQPDSLAYVNTSPNGYFNQRAQTFTVARSGYLAFLYVYIYGSNGSTDLIIDIRPTQNGIPMEDDSAAYGAVTVRSKDIPSSPPNRLWDGQPYPVTMVDLRGLTLTANAGEVLAITMRATESLSGFGLPGTLLLAGQDYTGGQALTRNNYFSTWGAGDGYFGSSRADWIFGTYACDSLTHCKQPDLPVFVPEPGSVALLALGLLGLGFTARRRLH